MDTGFMADTIVYRLDLTSGNEIEGTLTLLLWLLVSSDGVACAEVENGSETVKFQRIDEDTLKVTPKPFPGS
jgi:hypothetical protein